MTSNLIINGSEKFNVEIKFLVISQLLTEH